MAFKIIRDEFNNEQLGREITAILDSANDLASLGTNYAAGSVAMVADAGGVVYMMNASGEWREL